MPKVEGPLFSADAFGDLGELLNFHRRPGGHAVGVSHRPGSRVASHAVPTISQEIIRAYVGQAVDQWQTLTEEEKQLWRDFVSGDYVPEIGVVVEQLIVGGKNVNLSNAATRYNVLAGGSDWVGTLNYVGGVVSAPGILKKLAFKLNGSPGSGKSYTFALMVNGVAQALSVQISGSATTGMDTTNEIPVAAGDFVCLRCVPSGTPTSRVAVWSIVFKGSNIKESLILGLGYTSKTAIKFVPLSFGHVYYTDTEPESYQVIPTPGKIKNLCVSLYAFLSVAPDAYRFTLRVNGANSDDGEGNPLQVTIVAPGLIGSDVVHQIPVVAGDRVCLMCEPLETPAVAPIIRWGLTFVADNEGESLILGQSSDPPTLGSTEYNILASCDRDYSWAGTESVRVQGGQAGFTLKKFYAWVSAVLAGTYALKVRCNATNTGIGVTIPVGAQSESDTTNSKALSDYDYLALSCLAYTTSAHLHWGLVCLGPVPAAGFLPRKMAVDGYRCFVEQYVKNMHLGASPWKLPDGIRW